MTVSLQSPTCTVVDYCVVNYRNGKQAGIEQFFGSVSEIRMYFADGAGRLPNFTTVHTHERIEDRKNLDGLVIEERKWRRAIGDMDLRGTRIYE